MLPCSKHLGWFAMLSASLVLQEGALRAADDSPIPGSYQVVDGRVDTGTFGGWVTYHTACHICHGSDAMGTDIAPNLRESLKSMTQTEFTSKVMMRYRIFVAPTEALSTESRRQAVLDEVIRHQRGDRGRVAMPAWQSDPDIKPHILDLYAYLKARSDGALGPGQPKTIQGR